MCRPRRHKKWVDANVTNVHKTYIMDHFIERSEWTPSPYVNARLSSQQGLWQLYGKVGYWLTFTRFTT